MSLQSQGRRVVRAMSRLWCDSARTTLFRLLTVLGFAVAAWLLAGTASAYADSGTAQANPGSDVLAPIENPANSTGTLLTAVADQPQAASTENASTQSGAATGGVPAVAQSSSDTPSVLSLDLPKATHALLGSLGASQINSPLVSVSRPLGGVAGLGAHNPLGFMGSTTSGGSAGQDGAAPLPSASSVETHKADVARLSTPDSQPSVDSQAKGHYKWPAYPSPALFPSDGAIHTGGGFGGNSGSALAGSGAVLPESVMPKLNDHRVVGSLEDTAVVSYFCADRSFSPD